jgi:3-phosphoshikimate 1-carboxyvinyltransferase
MDYMLPVASAQVKSAILLAGLYACGAVTVQVPGPARDHTERMMAAMGGQLEWGDWRPEVGGQRVRLEPGRSLNALDIRIPGDFSSAAFLIVAATLVKGSEITVLGVGVNPTRTGLLDILRTMGADLTLQNQWTQSGEPVADITVHHSELHGVEVSGPLVVRAIDELPVLAVAASQAQGETLVRDAAELRVKETDRIATTVQELRRLGADLEGRPDGFLVRGPTPLKTPGPRERAAPAYSHGDHRLAMALAVAGLLADRELVIEDVDCIGDSFPGFGDVLTNLGGEVQ